MSMTSNQLKALFARRREQEHMRLARATAVSRYYDHWDKVNTRYGNWTAPEYYEQAEAKLTQCKQKKEKEQQLTERRKKLHVLMDAENEAYELEQRQQSKNRGRKYPVDNNTLKRIEEKVKETENIKRKLDLEAKLYGKWRHGVYDENIIFDSKSDNEVLAKLNWLDKQVEEQLQRERDESLAEDRKLRLQEDMLKLEETQKERQKIREQEIKEIRALQELHMEQLQQRQTESEDLKEQEHQMRSHLEELEKELNLLTESSAVALESVELSQANNSKKIKVYIRKRSELFRNQIELALSILKRVSAYCPQKGHLLELQLAYKEQLDAETHTLSQIDTMYESEAKYSLQRCEENWKSQELRRYQDLKLLLKDVQTALSTMVEDNLARQIEIMEIRDTHLNCIEGSNEKLKQLFKEQEDSPRAQNLPELLEADTVSLTNSQTEQSSAAKTRASGALPKLTNSFTNLNLDVWQDLPSARAGIDTPRQQSQRSKQVETTEMVERPKFGRKRVAWT